MGTYAIFKALQQHWSSASHPIYRADVQRYSPKEVNRLKAPTRHSAASYILNYAALAIIAGTLIAIFADTIFLLTGLVIFFLLVGVSWIGPFQLGPRLSQSIAREREQQTLDTLLTTPLGWSEIVLAKLAAGLRATYLGEILWTQVLFFLIVVGAAIYFLATAHYHIIRPGTDNILLPVIYLLWSAAYCAAARAQDYILLGLLELGLSAVTTSGQVAAILGRLVGPVYMLCWLFLIIAVFPLLRDSFFAALLLAAAGPAGAFTLALPLPAAILSGGLAILLREGLIVVCFRWLERHLADGAGLIKI